MLQKCPFKLSYLPKKDRIGSKFRIQNVDNLKGIKSFKSLKVRFVSCKQPKKTEKKLVQAQISKKYYQKIFKPLVHLFYRSFKTGYIPLELKTCTFLISNKINPEYNLSGLWYIRDHTKYTASSSRSTLFKGVPQSCVLGPILSLILINNLANISDKLYHTLCWWHCILKFF